ncbi:MAG: DEAD/DEAH box helicase [Bdellovibrionales bacterium]
MEDKEIGFAELGIDTNFLKALDDLGFKSPTEIQQKSIPLLMSNQNDFVGQAQTGTGKTAAFALPLLQNLSEEKGKKPQALILAPTRELAMQISDEIFKFTKYNRVEKVSLCGGMSYKPQLDALRSGKLQLVVGTPGRVIDMINRGALDLSEIQNIVLDEADEMLNMGFLEEVQKIIEASGDNRRLWMFSATMPKQIKKIIEKSFRNPIFVNTKVNQVTNTDIEQSYYLVKDKYKLNALTQVLDLIENFYGVIFCETRQETKDLGLALMNLNYNTSVLHGDLSQSERTTAMRNFKKGKTKVLICTDVAARGIDVDNLSHVINYGLPRDKESYVHRIGRTGRAGNKGHAISILRREDLGRLSRIEQLQSTAIKRDRLPNIRKRKEILLDQRSRKIDTIISYFEKDRESYAVDEVFSIFSDRFDTLSKDESLKVIFNSWFRNDLRRMEELEDIELEISKENLKSARSARDSGRGRSGGRRGGGRSGDRRSSGGRGGSSDRRSSGRRSDRSESSERRSSDRSSSRRSEQRSDRPSQEWGSERKPARRSEKSPTDWGGSKPSEKRSERRPKKSSERRTDEASGGRPEGRKRSVVSKPKSTGSKSGFFTPYSKGKKSEKPNYSRDNA